MKDIIIVSVIAGLLFIGTILYVSCETEYQVSCQYEICYPDTTIAYDTIFNCVHTNNGEDLTIIIKCESSRGTNYLRIDPGFNTPVSTTAPIRIINFKEVNTKK